MPLITQSPPNQPSERMRLLRRTYLLCTLPLGLALIALCSYAYVRAFDLSLTVPLKQQALSVQAGYFLALITAALASFVLGGWIWAQIMKRYFRVTRVEMEAFLLNGTYRFDWLDRANLNAINKLYDADKKSTRHHT